MSPIILAALAALLLLAAATVVTLRNRRRATPEQAPVPERRRAATLVAEPVATLASDPLTRAAPRAAADIGLTPWEASTTPLAEPDEVDAPNTEDPAEPAYGFDEPRFTDQPSPPPLADGDEPSAPSDDEPPSILAQLKGKKKAGSNALAGAAEGAVDSASGPPAPSEVEEDISLVLRRQVPIRHEPPRSWLGGRPMMAEAIDWPRAPSPDRPGESELPLNFVAQLACADFPAELWGGLGPRAGWLLLFVNPRDGQGDDPRIVRVLHIDALGAERDPPADTPPVVDPELADGDYRWLGSVGQIPAGWQRWPIDLVALPNQAHDDGNRIVVTPRDFATTLYDGAPIEPGRPDIGDERPYSWRGALYAVDAALRVLAEPTAAARIPPAIREMLDRPGYVAALVPELRARHAHWLSEGEGAILAKEEPLRERELELRDMLVPEAAARVEAIDRLAGFIAAHPGSTALAGAIDRGAADEAAWRAGTAERLASIRAGIEAHPLDTPLAGDEWDALAATLDADSVTRWTADWASRNSDLPVMLAEQRLSLLDLARPGIEAGVVECAATDHGDPALAGLVPPHFIDGLAPYWRQLTDNRPHRVGGFHDGLQSDPEPGPQSELLLFQIASDEAMHWNFGDGGAYFVTIAPRDLAAGRFDRVEISLEQP